MQAGCARRSPTSLSCVGAAPSSAARARRASVLRLRLDFPHPHDAALRPPFFPSPPAPKQTTPLRKTPRRAWRRWPEGASAARGYVDRRRRPRHRGRYRGEVGVLVVGMRVRVPRARSGTRRADETEAEARCERGADGWSIISSRLLSARLSDSPWHAS
ncbi:hypothetical protein C8R45DRAFT_90821 [Mycena sanguinolenta]|nr:hypothetical protein C8R45DRAFT_90821 [Mycena sanguinolenta]